MNVNVDGSDAFLNLRKDNLIVPKEFFMSAKDDAEIAFINESSKIPDIPLLKLPKNAADEWRQRLIIER